MVLIRFFLLYYAGHLHQILDDNILYKLIIGTLFNMTIYNQHYCCNVVNKY